MNIRTALFLLGLALLVAGCGNNDSTPTSPTTTTPVAAPTVTDTFSGTLPVGGFRFYSFTVTENGTVNLTLTSVSGAFVPSTVMLGLGIGTPSGVDCATTATVTAAAGSAPQLTGTFSPGLYCARMYDVGNLFGPATFSMDIAHP